MEREQKKKQQELAERRQVEAVNNIKKPATNGGRGDKEGGSGAGGVKKADDPKKRLEDLLIGAMHKVKAPIPLATSNTVPAGGGGASGNEVTAGAGSEGQSNGYVVVCVQGLSSTKCPVGGIP